MNEFVTKEDETRWTLMTEMRLRSYCQVLLMHVHMHTPADTMITIINYTREIGNDKFICVCVRVHGCVSCKHGYQT